MLIPKDFDLPDKFMEFRPNQLQLAAKIASGSRYAFLLDAPTGVGKSLIAATAQRIYGKGIVYLCNTKQLQDQILHDFPYAKTLKGRNNYICLKYRKLFPQVSAEECTHNEADPCPHISECPYKIAKAEALSAPLAVLNTAYFLSESNYVGAFGKPDFLVVDEFDSIEDQLMNFIELRITKRQLDRYHIPPPKFKTKADAWRDWAKETLSSLTPKLAALEAASESDQWGGVDFRTLREAKWLEKLVAKLKYFVREVDDTWVPYFGEEAWAFKPTWVSRYANQVLWDHADKVLGMSATILNPRQVCLNTGLVSKTGRTYDYIQMKSPFPKENRPVYYEPCANVINKEMDKALPRLAAAMRGLVQKYPNDRILVHTVSYKVRDYLLCNLRSKRVITHSTSDRAVVLDKFKVSKEPLVLLSPSMDRGVDLVDDECRVVVIAKCLPEDAMAVTPYGPKRWDQLKVFDNVFSLDYSGSICLKPVTRIFHESYEGPLVSFTNSIITPTVTPDHRMVVTTRKSAALRYVLADDIPPNGYYRVPFAGIWCGKHADRISLRQFTQCVEEGKHQPVEFDAGDFFEFLGWYISEGHPQTTTVEHDGYRSWKTNITQTKDEGKNRIKALLRKMGFGYYIGMENGREKKFVISGRILNEAMMSLIPKGAHFKRIPSEFLKYDSMLLHRLFDGLTFGDGSRPEKKTWSFMTSSRGLCWDFCELCMKLGYSIKVYVKGEFHYEVWIRSAKTATVSGKTQISYSGTIWCITVPTGNFLAYQNGSYFFTGNCPYPDLSDPQISKRVYASKDGSEWYSHKTISTIIQMSGRAVRSATDHADTYVLDAQFEKLYGEHRFMFPTWYREAIIM